MELIEGVTSKIDLKKIIVKCREGAPKNDCIECACNKGECIGNLIFELSEIKHKGLL
jgi:hypothetical protein